jgi:tyrosyl-tRNA synthetase
MKKFMQVPDACVRQYYELLTNVPLEDVERLLAGHPKEAKVTLAKNVIGQYHAAAAADEAAARWQREIGEGGLPSDIPDRSLSRSQLGADGSLQAAALLKTLGLCPSTSDAIRLIEGGGAYYFDGDEKLRINERQQAIHVRDGMLIQAGKKKICRIRLSPQ